MYAFSDSSIPQSVTQSAPVIVDSSYRCDLVTEPAYRHYLTTRVTVQTLCYGKQEAEIIAVLPSPFVGETHMVAFVANLPLPGVPSFTDYIPLKDTPEYNSGDCDCGKHVHESLMCPECGYCLGCCDCTTENADDLLDVAGYQPPRFMWMGRLFPESID